MLTIIPTDTRVSYAAYFTEILRSEGFRSLQTCPMDKLSQTALHDQPVVILPHVLECDDTVRQLCSAYVRDGGTLVVLHPTDSTAQTLGVPATGQIVPQAVLTVPIADGTELSIAVRVPVAKWEATGVEVLLWCAYGAQRLPAMVRFPHGSGTIIAIAFDIAEVIALTRQGDATLSGLHTAAGDGVFRATDLFAYQLEPLQSKAPVLDVLTAWIANLLVETTPLARIWYYPQMRQRSALVLTCDDAHSSPADYRVFIEALAGYGLHCTFFLQRGCEIAPAATRGWTAEGHAFSTQPMHRDDTQQAPVRAVVREDFAVLVASSLEWFRRNFGAQHRTTRLFRERWLGHTDAAALLARHGIEMDFSYVPRAPFGAWLCGSSRPVRFVTRDGTLLPIFQQPTSWSDHIAVDATIAGGYRWSPLLAELVTDEIITVANTLSYSPVIIATSPARFAAETASFITANWRAAQAHDMLTVSGDEWLDWTVAREASEVRWVDDVLELRADRDIAALTVLLPPECSPVLPTQLVTRWGKPHRAVTVALIANTPVTIATKS